MSTEDSVALARFEEQVLTDSLRQAAERQAKYEEQQRKWDAERQARYKHRRDSFRAKPLSPRAKEYLADKQRWDSIRASRPQKIAEGTTLDINAADSNALMSVPLIGSGRAKQVIYYRDKLGGYVSVNQLKEIANMPPEITRWFSVSTSSPIRKLRINHDDFRTLVAHPYLSYEQVKIIMNYRRKIGPIKSWSDLSLSSEFTEHDFKRLTPYISFD